MRIRTGYSFRTAVGHLDDVMSRLQEIGSVVAPISDRMSTFGFARWTARAEKAGLRPIYGVEIPVVRGLGDKNADYWTFFATKSLAPLHNLCRIATRNGGVTYVQAMNTPELIKVTGDRVILEEIENPTDKNLYFGLSPSVSKGLLKDAKALGMRLVAMSDNLYPREEDKEFYRVALGRLSTTQTYPLWIMSDRETFDFWTTRGLDQDEIARAMKRRLEVYQRCTATMRKAKLLVPEKNATLLDMCLAGAQNLGVPISAYKTDDPNEYEVRLDKELAIIAEKGFEDYFYILADLVGWARERMVVGPGRGSAGGSLVCYLLGITSVDPIKYGLIFERFIDINRDDLPDIDVDFSDIKRQEILDYADQKYGRSHVAQLGTVSAFKVRSALRQIGMALDIPPWITGKYADGIKAAEASLAEAFDDDSLTGLLLRDAPGSKVAVRLENHPTHASQHAAGLLITDEPIAEFVAVDDKTRAAWCDKKDAEALNLLKIDVLGLTQLSVFERALELIGKEPSFLDTIPMEDQAAFDVLNRGDFSGVFQFVGHAVQGLSQQVNITSVEDMAALISIARPGPLNSGAAQSWVDRKNGKEKVKTLAPELTELTKETYGTIVYQETAMRVVRELGGMSWAQTSEVRRAISRKTDMDKFEKLFVDGAVKNGLDAEVARQIWNQIATFGAYAFNKSHAIAYAIIGYWCCWFKAHYPLEFAAATLDAESDPDKQLDMLRELDSEGVKYIPLDPDHSTDKWVVKDGHTLVGPLSVVQGIGPAKVKNILDSRSAGTDLDPKLHKQLSRAKTKIDSLYPVRDAIGKIDLEKKNIRSKLTPIKDAQPGFRGEAVVIGLVKRLSIKDEVEAARKKGKSLRDPQYDKSLNVFLMDDEDEILCKVNRYDFPDCAPAILEKVKQGKTLMLVGGFIPRGFRMIGFKNYKILGRIDEKEEEDG